MLNERQKQRQEFHKKIRETQRGLKLKKMNIEPWSPLAPPKAGKHRTSNSPQASKHLSAFGGSNVE